MMIIGATAASRPILSESLAPQIISFDMWVTFGVSALFTAILLSYGKINKLIGGVFTIGYVTYMGALYVLYIG